MFTLPSASRLILPAVVIFGVVLACRIIQFKTSGNSHDLISAFLNTQVQHGNIVTYELDETGPLDAPDRSAALFLFQDAADIRPNTHVERLLQCPLQPNPFTSHIRVSSSPLRNIVMTPPAQKRGTLSSYFNPTLIPLPPSSRHQYLVLSRLVTLGLHQESHICPATHTNRGKNNSIECVMPAVRLNIPPTPAWRCEGRWAPFADIPGFHDPRMFWSGKGEPLVIVNSGSKSVGGCVGLWIVDLRAVVPELDEWLSADGAGENENENDEDRIKDHMQHPTVGMDAKMSYPHLTELTKNPGSARSPVEKNWVLFFPKAEETWMMYNLLGKSIRNPETELEDEKVQEEQDILQVVSGVGATIRPPDADKNDLPEISRQDETFRLQHNVSVVWSDNASLLSHHQPRHVSGQGLSTTTSKRDALPAVRPDRSLQTQGSVVPQRTLAKVIGSGFTTTNLTSPFESACFDMTHIYDALGNEGHWHQGSNALRLVLCHRSARSQGSSIHQEQAECTMTAENERHLVESGKVVHFMILHRKFSNALDLPLRYERFLVVWEARQPFRVLGVSRYPLLFRGERAMPWTDEENWADTKEDVVMEEEMRPWKKTTFTYTPSLAWAWRGTGFGERDEQAGDLGTGYIGDDLIVGIGMDDVRQGFVRLKVEDLLGCLRLCPDFDRSVKQHENEQRDNQR